MCRLASGPPAPHGRRVYPPRDRLGPFGPKGPQNYPTGPKNGPCAPWEHYQASTWFFTQLAVPAGTSPRFRTDLPTFNCCSRGTLSHFGLQGWFHFSYTFLQQASLDYLLLSPRSALERRYWVLHSARESLRIVPLPSTPFY